MDFTTLSQQLPDDDRPPITSEDRFTAEHPCPICGGYAGIAQGLGERCWGFLTPGGDMAYCTREEYAGDLDIAGDSGAYPHWMDGPCGCGAQHDTVTNLQARATAQRTARTRQHQHPATDNRVRRIRRTDYELVDADGEVVGIHHRDDYAVTAPDGTVTRDKHVWWTHHHKRRAVDMPLYGAYDVAHARWNARVYVTEGEKAADALRHRDVLAVGTVTGAQAIPCDRSLKALIGHDIVLWPDHDDIGYQHMARIAERLQALHQTVRWVDWADAPDKGDAADYIAAGGAVTVTALDTLIRDIPPAVGDAPGVNGTGKQGADSDTTDNHSDNDNTSDKKGGSSGGSGGGKDKDKQSRRLFAVARRQARVFTGEDGNFYLAEHQRGLEAYLIRSSRTRRWLNRLYRRYISGSPPSAQAISETLESLEALAEISGVFPVWVRIATTPERVLLDLGNDAGQVADITADGWAVRDASYWNTSDHSIPTYFVRPDFAQALPLPDRTGTWRNVQAWLPAIGPDERPLVEAFIIHSFQHGGDYWTMALQGEHGSQKTFTAEILRTMVDPVKVRSSGPPRDEDALATHANQVGIVVLDNLSTIPEWLADALCRLGTGSGIMKRKLYTDMDVSGWYGQRPTIVATIADIIRAGDLLDRALIVPLDKRAEDRYVSKKRLWARFHTEHPKILGGILNTLVGVLKALPAVSSDYDGKLPRMTDATLYGLALERVLGVPKDPERQFLALYKANRKGAMVLQLEGSKIAEYLTHIAATKPWTGTMTDLLKRLNDELDIDYAPADASYQRRERAWPKTAAQLSAQVTRLAPALRSAGYSVDRAKPVRGMPLVWTLCGPQAKAKSRPQGQK